MNAGNLDAPALWERAGALLIVVDPQGRISHWNRTCEDLTGYTLAEARGAWVWEFLLPPEHRTDVRKMIEDIRKTGQRTHSEHDWVTRTGERRWIAWSDVPVMNEEGQLHYILRCGVDRTERRNTEAKALASQVTLSGIIAIAADAIITLDAQQRITLFNEGAEQIFGWRREEVLGASLDLLLPERFRAIHRQHVRDFAVAPEKARRMGQRREVSGLRKNGNEFPADAAISKLNAQGTQVFTVVLRDLTERKRRESEQQFLATAGTILSSSLDYQETLSAVGELSVQAFADCCIIDIVDGDRVQRMRVVTRDPAKRALCDRLCDIPLEQLPLLSSKAILETGQSVLNSDLPPDQVTSLVQNEELLKLMRELAPRSFMGVPMRARDHVLGTLLFLSSTPGRFSQAGLPFVQELAHRAALAVDNARLYRAAQEAIRAREEILATVSHDLRNPLNAINLSVVSAKRKLQGDSKVTKTLETAQRAATQAGRLVNDLLDLSTIEHGHLSLDRERFKVDALLQEARETLLPLAHSAALALTVEIPTELPWLSADRQRLVQAFSNLVGNAIKFTPAGGEIRITARSTPTEVLFSVSDTGCGIPATALPHLFERPWQPLQKRQGGAGLGLAITKGIIEAHGGRIWAESTLGAGSTFHFAVPFPPDTTESAHEEKPVH